VPAVLVRHVRPADRKRAGWHASPLKPHGRLGVSPRTLTPACGRRRVAAV
jgi:hypothetical protein